MILMMVKMMINNNLIATIASGLFVTLIINIFVFTLFGLMIKNNTRSNTAEKNIFWCTIISIIILLMVVFVPIYHGLSISQLLRSIAGDLSISSLLVLVMLLWNNLFNYQVDMGDFEPRVRRYKIVPSRTFAFTIVIFGIILYSSYLGFIRFDLYDTGYFPSITFMVILGVIELLLWFTARRYAIIWLIAIICFYFKLQPSHNLWDYLFDPVLWLICLIRLLRF